MAAKWRAVRAELHTLLDESNCKRARGINERWGDFFPRRAFRECEQAGDRPDASSTHEFLEGLEERGLLPTSHEADVEKIRKSLGFLLFRLKYMATHESPTFPSSKLQGCLKRFPGVEEAAARYGAGADGVVTAGGESSRGSVEHFSVPIDSMDTTTDSTADSTDATDVGVTPFHDNHREHVICSEEERFAVVIVDPVSPNFVQYVRTQLLREWKGGIPLQFDIHHFGDAGPTTFMSSKDTPAPMFLTSIRHSNPYQELKPWRILTIIDDLSDRIIESEVVRLLNKLWPDAVIAAAGHGGSGFCIAGDVEHVERVRTSPFRPYQNWTTRALVYVMDRSGSRSPAAEAQANHTLEILTENLAEQFPHLVQLWRRINDANHWQLDPPPAAKIGVWLPTKEDASPEDMNIFLTDVLATPVAMLRGTNIPNPEKGRIVLMSPRVEDMYRTGRLARSTQGRAYFGFQSTTVLLDEIPRAEVRELFLEYKFTGKVRGFPAEQVETRDCPDLEEKVKKLLEAPPSRVVEVHQDVCSRSVPTPRGERNEALGKFLDMFDFIEHQHKTVQAAPHIRAGWKLNVDMWLAGLHAFGFATPLLGKSFVQLSVRKRSGNGAADDADAVLLDPSCTTNSSAIVLGCAGEGKSTLLRHFVRVLAHRNETGVFVRADALWEHMSSLTERPVCAWADLAVRSMELPPSLMDDTRKCLEHCIAAGGCTLLVDALDELSWEIRRTPAFGRKISRIIELSKTGMFTRVIFSSRYLAVEPLPRELEQYVIAELDPVREGNLAAQLWANQVAIQRYGLPSTEEECVHLVRALEDLVKSGSVHADHLPDEMDEEHRGVIFTPMRVSLSQFQQSVQRMGRNLRGSPLLVLMRAVMVSEVEGRGSLSLYSFYKEMFSLLLRRARLKYDGTLMGMPLTDEEALSLLSLLGLIFHQIGDGIGDNKVWRFDAVLMLEFVEHNSGGIQAQLREWRKKAFEIVGDQNRLRAMGVEKDAASSTHFALVTWLCELVGLLRTTSNSRRPLDEQVYFSHRTVQEFLTAHCLLNSHPSFSGLVLLKEFEWNTAGVVASHWWNEVFHFVASEKGAAFIAQLIVEDRTVEEWLQRVEDDKMDASDRGLIRLCRVLESLVYSHNQDEDERLLGRVLPVLGAIGESNVANVDSICRMVAPRLYMSLWRKMLVSRNGQQWLENFSSVDEHLFVHTFMPIATSAQLPWLVGFGIERGVSHKSLSSFPNELLEEAQRRAGNLVAQGALTTILALKTTGSRDLELEPPSMNTAESGAEDLIEEDRGLGERESPTRVHTEDTPTLLSNLADNHAWRVRNAILTQLRDRMEYGDDTPAHAIVRGVLPHVQAHDLAVEVLSNPLLEKPLIEAMDSLSDDDKATLLQSIVRYDQKTQSEKNNWDLLQLAVHHVFVSGSVSMWLHIGAHPLWHTDSGDSGELAKLLAKQWCDSEDARQAVDIVVASYDKGLERLNFLWMMSRLCRTFLPNGGATSHAHVLDAGHVPPPLGSSSPGTFRLRILVLVDHSFWFEDFHPLRVQRGSVVIASEGEGASTPYLHHSGVVHVSDASAGWGAALEFFRVSMTNQFTRTNSLHTIVSRIEPDVAIVVVGHPRRTRPYVSTKSSKSSLQRMSDWVHGELGIRSTDFDESLADDYFRLVQQRMHTASSSPATKPFPGDRWRRAWEEWRAGTERLVMKLPVSEAVGEMSHTSLLLNAVFAVTEHLARTADEQRASQGDSPPAPPLPAGGDHQEPAQPRRLGRWSFAEAARLVEEAKRIGRDFDMLSVAIEGRSAASCKRKLAGMIMRGNISAEDVAAIDAATSGYRANVAGVDSVSTNSGPVTINIGRDTAAEQQQRKEQEGLNAALTKVFDDLKAPAFRPHQEFLLDIRQRHWSSSQRPDLGEWLVAAENERDLGRTNIMPFDGQRDSDARDLRAAIEAVGDVLDPLRPWMAADKRNSTVAHRSIKEKLGQNESRRLALWQAGYVLKYLPGANNYERELGGALAQWT